MSVHRAELLSKGTITKGTFKNVQNIKSDEASPKKAQKTLKKTDSPMKVKQQAELDPIITTPRLVSVKALTPGFENPNVKDLGPKSEISKAKRVEDAIKFWLNQSSFHLSPQKQFSDSVENEIESFPAEMRRALASGVVHSVRSGNATNRRRQLQSIFSDEDICIQNGAMVTNATNPTSSTTTTAAAQNNQITAAEETCGSISFSVSEN